MQRTLENAITWESITSGGKNPEKERDQKGRGTKGKKASGGALLGRTTRSENQTLLDGQSRKRGEGASSGVVFTPNIG